MSDNTFQAFYEELKILVEKFEKRQMQIKVESDLDYDSVKIKEYSKIRPEKNIAIVSHSSYIGQMIFKKIEDEKNELKHCHPYLYKL